MRSNYTKNTEHYEHETVVKYVDEDHLNFYCFDCDVNESRLINDIRFALRLHPTELKQSVDNTQETQTVTDNTNTTPMYTA